MENGIKSKVVSGLIWTYFERFSAQLVSLIVSIILARLLSASEYGVVAIVTIFIDLSNVLVVNGFGTALVQKKDPLSVEYSTVFYASTFLTLVVYILLCLCSPFIASFYDIPELNTVLRVVGIAIPIAAISSIQQSFIAKKMEFKKFFFSTIIGTVISGIIGIVMAYRGFGVWALVAQLLSNRIIDTVILTFTSGWRLTREFSWTSLRSLFSYSWKITASSLLISFYDNIRGLVVGKKYSIDDLAYYNKGRNYPNLVAGNINTSISKVLFPALSDEQNDKERVLFMTRRAIKESTFILTPLLFGLASCSKQFVSVLLTEKWLPIVPYIVVMCVVYSMQPMQTASIQAMKAIGRSDYYLKLEIIKKVANFIILIISLFMFNSVFAVAIGALLAELSSTLINVPANKALFGYSYKLQLFDVLPEISAALLMAVVVIIVGLLPLSKFILLIIQVLAGGLIYYAIAKVFKMKSLNYLESTINEVLHRRKS